MTRERKLSLLTQTFMLVAMDMLNPHQAPALRRLSLVEPWDIEESPVQKRFPQSYGVRERAQKRRRKSNSPLVAAYRHPMLRD